MRELLPERRVLVPQQIAREQLRGMGAGGSLTRMEGAAMGTVWTATALVPQGKSLADLQTVIAGAFDEVIRQMSGWSESSDLSRFNRALAGSWHELPEDFFTVLARALEVAEATAGAYDPTVGELVDLLGFGPSQREETASESQLQAAKARLGWRRLKTNPAARQAFQPGGARVDLSSIAKGYAVDLAARRLIVSGVENFLVELGGEAFARGCKPDGQPWWCWVERPPVASGKAVLPETIVALCDGALASSGGYRRQRSVAGRRQTHIVDPHTGSPDGGTLASVTVLSGSCMDADAYATALFVLGPAKGFDWAESRNLPALFVWETSEGLAEKWTTAWGRMLE